jgi:outer membrane murein-binding lipoprotein Lpp
MDYTEFIHKAYTNRGNTMNRLKMLGVALLASTLLLSGCSDQLEDNLKEVATGAQNAVHQVGDLIQDTGADWSKDMRNQGVSTQLNKAQSLSNATTLNINHPLGNITIEPSSTSGEIKVVANLWGSQSDAEKEKIKQIFQQAEISLVPDQETLTLLIHPQGNQDENLWDWAQNQYNTSKFLVDYTIYVPEQVTAYQIHSNVGNITMSKLQGSLQLQADVGEIQVQEVQIAGDSSIIVNTGQLDMSIDEQSNFTSLSAKVELGNLVAKVPATLPSEVEATTELGELTGIDKEGVKLNGGGPPITLTTSVGNITVSH